jgi:flagellar basal-body rod protein FlgF
MLYGLYLSAQGAEVAALRQATLANNMANAGTTAFKPDVPVFQAHLPFDVAWQQPTEPPETWNEQTGGVSLAGTVTDFRQGPLQVTGGTLDVALMGPGFFEVESDAGVVLSRNGRFAVDADNTLVTADDGHPVLDEAGQTIVLPPNAEQISISDDGLLQVRSPEGINVPLARLSVVVPENELQLMKQGNSYYQPNGPTSPAVAARVRQGVLEGSGVEPVEQMVELIQSSKFFEMNMNLMQYQDSMLGTLLQGVGRR